MQEMNRELIIIDDDKYFLETFVEVFERYFRVVGANVFVQGFLSLIDLKNNLPMLKESSGGFKLALVDSLEHDWVEVAKILNELGIPLILFTFNEDLVDQMANDPRLAGTIYKGAESDKIFERVKSFFDRN